MLHYDPKHHLKRGKNRSVMQQVGYVTVALPELLQSDGIDMGGMQPRGKGGVLFNDYRTF
jgi:hypothetical protein